MISWSDLEKILSYHAVYNETFFDSLLFANKNGFAGIQIAVETPHLSFEKLSEIDCKKIRDYCEKNNLFITLHAPDDYLEITYNYIRGMT